MTDTDLGGGGRQVGAEFKKFQTVKGNWRTWGHQTLQDGTCRFLTYMLFHAAPSTRSATFSQTNLLTFPGPAQCHLLYEAFPDFPQADQANVFFLTSEPLKPFIFFLPFTFYFVSFPLLCMVCLHP